MTRTSFVSAVLLGFGLAGWVSAQESRVPFVYVSGYRPEIAIFRLDTAAGRLTPSGKAHRCRAATIVSGVRSGGEIPVRCQRDRPRPRPFVRHQSGNRRADADQRCAVDGEHHGAPVDRQDRKVAPGRQLWRHQQGTIASIPIGADGRLSEAVDTREFGLGSMAHYISSDPGNRFVFVPLKGGPAVAQLVFDPATGRLKPNVPPQVTAAPGAGPRHLDFHPNGRFACVMNELDLTMTAFTYDAKTGLLRELQVLPTLPAAADKVGASGADVHVHRSGRFVYGRIAVTTASSFFDSPTMDA